MINEKIRSVRLSDVKSVVQEFIFSDLMPIPKHTVSMLSAAGGLGKTYLGLKLAMNYTIEKPGEAVAVWMTEDEPEFVKARSEQLKRDYNIESKENNIHIITTPPSQMAYKQDGIFKANYEAFLNVREFCIERGITFIIIDPLLAFYGGEENNNAQARVFMQPFLEWAKGDGVSILLIHHAKKDGTGTRGASAFVDATRAVYELDYVYEEGEDNIFDLVAYNAGKRQLTLAKDNRGAKVALHEAGLDTSYEVQVAPQLKARP